MLFAPIALLPVVAFLLVLRLIDSYSLVPVREILRAVVVGVVVAALCWMANPTLAGLMPAGLEFRHYGAPVIEETAKADNPGDEDEVVRLAVSVRQFGARELDHPLAMGRHRGGHDQLQGRDRRHADG